MANGGFGISASDAMRLKIATDGITDDDVKQLFSNAIESSFRYSGAGSYYSRYGMVLSQYDRYGYNPLPPNREHTGLTFITRPRLNFQRTNLRQDSVMAWLDSVDPMSLPFSIRAYLDAEWADQKKDLVEFSPFVNGNSPFIIPLTNCMKGITGFPDFMLDTITTEQDFYGGDQTIVAGSNFNQNTNDLTLTFRDIQGGYISALFLAWLRTMALLRLGIMVAYPEDIAYNEMCYSCSIYRFVLDPSKKFIVKWAKGTGCFPVNLPSGSFFNINDGETFSSSGAEFSVTFKMNHFHMQDGAILKNFNTLVNRFVGGDPRQGRLKAPSRTYTNFTGIPYIDTEGGRNELMFLASEEELQNPAGSIVQQMQSKAQALRSAASNF